MTLAQIEIERRSHTTDELRDLEYVLSDGSVDNFGTVLDPKGWDFSQFRKNPTALFNHNKDFVIGRWHDYRVTNGELRAKLELAEPGTSARHDELRSLVRQGLIKTTSVGFIPLEIEPPKEGAKGPVRLKRNLLLEGSLVSVPANKNAVQIARGMNISRETLRMVFGESAIEEAERSDSGSSGKSAERNPDKRNGTMPTIAERVQSAQADFSAARAALEAFQNDLDNTDIKDEQLTRMQQLTTAVRDKEKIVNGLREMEAALGVSAQPIVVRGTAPQPEDRQQQQQQQMTHRPFAAPMKNKVTRPGDHMMRALIATVIARAKKVPAAQILAERYGEDGHCDPETRTVLDVVNRGEGHNPFDFLMNSSMLTRVSRDPATTFTSGWASQLVETSNADFMQLLVPASVYAGLAPRGLRLSFGRSGIINIPSRLSTPNISGAFVLEGNPIPVKQGAFTSVQFTPKKMAVISTWTREIGEHSTPAVEALIRNAIQEDTSTSLDSVLLDATAATQTRPAGIRAGVSVTTATAGGGFAALVGDIKALLGALITSSNGNLRSPVWIMNPIQAISVSLTQNAGGDFPFANEINGNSLKGYPVIQSANVTAGMVILVDAADFVVIEGGAPRFDLSDQATIHMDDAPAPLSATGSPNTVAAPIRSLWQTDSIGLRMILDVNWGFRRTGVVAWTQAVTW